MSARRLSTVSILVLAGLIVLPTMSSASDQFATFESFYRESLGIAWIIAFAAVAAIITGAVIFFSGGTATPFVASIGTSIGGLMGLSGIAATNAGLALLGGGAIAVGGFGIIGGTALLTAALSFSTAVVFDSAVSATVAAYNYATFAKQSQTMITLPLPQNTSGPDAYEDGMEVLEHVDAEQPLSSSANQKIIQKAINVASNSTSSSDLAEKSREQSLLALLHFISNDYKAAMLYASSAYYFAFNAKSTATLPAFIYGTCLLYEDELDFNRAVDFFNYSILGEIDNPLSPILFAIFLDRMMYRFGDGALSTSALDTVYALSQRIPYDERRAAIQLGLTTRYIMVAKLDQQRILSLTQTSNRSIKDSPKTLASVKAALQEYKSLLARSKAAIDSQTTILNTRKSFEAWETNWNTEINKMHQLWSEYSDGIKSLQDSVEQLDAYQAALRPPELGQLNENDAPNGEVFDEGNNLSGWIWLIFFGGITAVLLLVARSSRKAHA